MYPSFRPYGDEPSSGLRDSWLPYFDQYNLTFGFENHDHAYKRTKPMRNSVPDPTGTIYVGDGAWGVPPRPSLAAAAGRSVLLHHLPLLTFRVDSILMSACRPSEFIAGEDVRVLITNSFVVRVDLDNTSATLSAINQDGVLFDSVTKSTE